MEGAISKPLGLSDLMVPLSQIVSNKFKQVDLLVGVSKDPKRCETSKITTLLAKKVGHDSKDICCVFSHQLGCDRWRVITTHGTAQMTVVGEDFDINIHRDHLTNLETQILYKLNGGRNELLAELHGFSMPKDSVPYAKIHGNVLLCGDFSFWEPGILLALRHLFLANGAGNVAFVTPVITSCNCRILQNQGCQVLRLHSLKFQA